MKQIENILFLSVFLCIPIACIDNFDKNRTNNFSDDKKGISLPFNLQISLDVIGLELEHYKDQFKVDWNTNVHAQVIIEEAEILVQTAPKEFQNKLKNKIVELFAKNNLIIEFTNQNKITTKIELLQLTPLTKHNKIKRLKFPKKHKKKQKEAKQILAPKKIHGARRTMKRLKKEAAEQKRREYEEIKARIEAKKEAILKTKREAVLREEARIRENILREHAKLREKFLHKMQETEHSNSNEEYL